MGKGGCYVKFGDPDQFIVPKTAGRMDVNAVKPTSLIPHHINVVPLVRFSVFLLFSLVYHTPCFLFYLGSFPVSLIRSPPPYVLTLG